MHHLMRLGIDTQETMVLVLGVNWPKSGAESGTRPLVFAPSHTSCVCPQPRQNVAFMPNIGLCLGLSVYGPKLVLPHG